MEGAMTIDELLAKLTALHEAATVAEQEYDAYAQFNFSNAAYNHYPALVAEIRRLREELTKQEKLVHSFNLELSKFCAGSEFHNDPIAYCSRIREIMQFCEKKGKVVGRKEAEAQLATAKREGAVEELLRLADEWAASCEAEFFADWLRDRAAELEGK